MDINSLVDIKVEGFVSKNTNGIWKLICGDEKTAAQTAGQVCTLLGFSGYQTFELKPVPTNQVGQIHNLEEVDRESFNKHLQNRYEFIRYRRDLTSGAGKTHQGHGHHGHGHPHPHHGHHNKRPHHHKTEPVRHDHNCKGLYVICTPHASGNSTIHEAVLPPKQPVKPTVKPIVPLIRPGGVPSVQINTHTEEKVVDDSKPPDAQVEWPWLASIFVDGHLRCLGILLDRHWVITNGYCVNRTT